MAHVIVFLSYQLVVHIGEVEHFIISLNNGDFVFLTPLQLHFGPIFDLADALELNYYFKMADMLLFFLSYQLVVHIGEVGAL